MKFRKLFFCIFVFFFSLPLFSQLKIEYPEERRREMIDGTEKKPKNNTDDDDDNEKRKDDEEDEKDERERDEEDLDDNDRQEKRKEKSNERTITINSARTTEYKKIKRKNERKVKESEEDNEDESEESQDEKKDEKSEELEEEIVIFTGNVSISVSDGNSTSTIVADKVIYNKTRSTMEGTGNVQFERKLGSQVAEKFVGEYILFDIEKMQGVFYNGIVQQASNKKGRDPFSMHTYIAGKDESGVIGFKNSFLTTSKDEDSLWSIRASRLWVLPGSEMAFANGIFSIGVVPIFYLPFFYYPSDEMLFHPVFGFRNKEGYFVQTTTYLVGRKPLEKQEKTSSFSNFLQGDTLKKQKLEGLFFKKLDEDERIQDPSYLKIIFDMYSRLGYLIGTEGKFKLRNWYIRDIDFSAFLGFSYTIYPIKGANQSGKATNNLFSSFAPSGAKKPELNKSNLFGKIVPFRYNFHFNMSLTKEPFNVSIAFPFISDPYFKKDFMNRSENMNWFNYLLNKEKLAKESTSSSEESSYLWKVQGLINPYFQKIRPWISSISVDDISVAVNFYSKTNSKLKNYDALYSPERKFYYPQSAKPFLKVSMSGTIFSTSVFDKTKKSTSSKPISPLIKELKNPFLEAEALSEEKDEDSVKEEKEDMEEIEKDVTDNGNNSSADNNASNSIEKESSKESLDNAQKENTKEGEMEKKEEKKKKISEMTEEELEKKIDEITTGIYQNLTNTIIPLYTTGAPPSSSSYFFTNVLQYNLTYKLTGQFVQENIFDHQDWKEPKDINWKKFYSKYFKLKNDFSLNSSLSIYKGMLSLTNSFVFDSNYQAHPYIKDKAKEKTLKLNNYKANIFALKNANTLKFAPFIKFDLFKNTNFSWNLSEILLQRKFIGTVDELKWTVEKVKWKKESITVHNANAIFALTFKGYTQSLSLSMNLKPLLAAYSMQAAFSIKYTKATLSTKYFEKEKAKKKWYWDPLKLTLSFSLPYNISINQEYIYNIEDKKHDKYSINFSWKYLSASYLMSRAIPYKLNATTGWQPEGTEKKFLPSSFSLSFSNSSKPIELYYWKNRVNFTATFNGNLHFNLIRLTDSYFTFSPKIKFKIHEFVDLSFSVTSRNDAIVKYFGSTFNLPVKFSGETNILKDIGYSFFFWDTEKRKMSDFKVKSVDFQLTHNLKDWSMTISYAIKPKLKTENAKKIYKFDPVISFFVQWNPISDIRIKAKEEEKKFSVERGELK